MFINQWQQRTVSHTVARHEVAGFLSSFQTCSNSNPRRERKKTHNIAVKWNLMTKPEQQSQGQQLHRTKPDGSGGMRAAAHACATAINHGVACKLNTKAAREKKKTQLRCADFKHQTHLHILSVGADKMPSLRSGAVHVHVLSVCSPMTKEY